jgi:phosphohistidine phosphatase SixA/8-oxo-dGTP pyrophosphatase MutT (NUDIX family)
VAASTKPLAAAGAVVWRPGADQPDIAVVHRPRYDDWSLPKGKLAAGETELDAAVREVGEELGARVQVSRRLTRVRYDVADAGGSDAGRSDSDRPDRGGLRPKTVAYWSMRWLGGDFEASDEVDQVQWLPARQVRERLTYGTDRSVLKEFASVPVADATVVLVRHARAGKRSDWRGDDAQRPLVVTGERQAIGLARFLRYFAPDRVLSADRVRCIDTVRPFAEAAGLPLEIDPTFNDESYLDSAERTLTAIQALAKPGRSIVICSQGLTIPSVIDALGPGIQDASTLTRGRRRGGRRPLSGRGRGVAADKGGRAPPKRCPPTVRTT